MRLYIHPCSEKTELLRLAWLCSLYIWLHYRVPSRSDVPTNCTALGPLRSKELYENLREHLDRYEDSFRTFAA